jgi:hypothetical protein
VGGPDARLDQARARPVVKLTVGDPGRGARRGAAVTEIRRSRIDVAGNPERFVSLEEDTLFFVAARFFVAASVSWVDRGGRPAIAVIPACRHAYLHGS